MEGFDACCRDRAERAETGCSAADIALFWPLFPRCSVAVFKGKPDTKDIDESNS